ncbi:MAG: hypothetical protein V3R83_13545, partial [Gammaproteobacteria bacterium]
AAFLSAPALPLPSAARVRDQPDSFLNIFSYVRSPAMGSKESNQAATGKRAGAADPEDEERQCLSATGPFM